MNWLNRLVVCCECNRPTLHTIEDAGFEVGSLQHVSMPKTPSFVRPAIVGAAVAAVRPPRGADDQIPSIGSGR
jgi:hypothetical protein